MKTLNLITILLLLTSTTLSADEESKKAKCINGNCTNGKGVMIFPKGYKYSGKFQNGKPNGTGVFTHSNGTNIKGEWKDGNIYNGQGNLITIYYKKTGMRLPFDRIEKPKYIERDPASDCILQGKWGKGILHGSLKRLATKRGIISIDGKFVINGIYKKYIILHGKGRLYKDMISYQGEFKNDKLYNGTLIMEDKDGKAKFDVEKGYLVNASGKLTNPKIAIFTINGICVKNIKVEDIFKKGFCLKVSIVYPNGEKFIGNLVDGKKHGVGTLFSKDGKVLKKGRWKKDKHIGK